MASEEIAFETVTVNQQGQIIGREQRQTQHFVDALANGIILELMTIPGGTFLIGRHLVAVGGGDGPYSMGSAWR